MASKEVVERCDGEITQVLMVDGVEFSVVHEVDHIRRFDHRHAVRLQHATNPLNEAI